MYLTFILRCANILDTPVPDFLEHKISIFPGLSHVEELFFVFPVFPTTRRCIIILDTSVSQLLKCKNLLFFPGLSVQEDFFFVFTILLRLPLYKFLTPLYLFFETDKN
jgi:hypothetical protein